MQHLILQKQVLTEVGKETIVGWIEIRLFNIAQEGLVVENIFRSRLSARTV